jgi:hypothetical protein
MTFFCFFPARPLGRRLFTKRRFFLPLAFFGFPGGRSKAKKLYPFVPFLPSTTRHVERSETSMLVAVALCGTGREARGRKGGKEGRQEHNGAGRWATGVHQAGEAKESAFPFFPALPVLCDPLSFLPSLDARGCDHKIDFSEKTP